MNPVEAASPPLFPPARRRTRLRARPSGLKGHCRDRHATGLRPALDPGASTAPQHTAARAGAGAARRARGTEHKTKIKSLQPSLYGFRGLPSRVTMQVFVREHCTMIAAPSNVTLMEYRMGRIACS
jgi:hypothetical protein